MPSSHLILCCPLLLLPPIPPSIRVFSNESTLHMRWPKYWSFSFSILPSKEIPGLISFRMDWLDLLAVQGTLKNLLQHHSSKAPILQRSAFFTVQLSHPYMTTGKTIALTRQTFVGKVMSLLSNILSFVVKSQESHQMQVISFSLWNFLKTTCVRFTTFCCTRCFKPNLAVTNQLYSHHCCYYLKSQLGGMASISAQESGKGGSFITW